MYTISMRLAKSPNHILNIYGFELYLVHYLLRRKDQQRVCDIDGQKTKFVFASKGTQVRNLNPNLQ